MTTIYFKNEYNDRIAIFGHKFQSLPLQDLIDLLGIVSQAYGFAVEGRHISLHTYTALAYLEKALTPSLAVKRAVDVLDRFPLSDTIGLISAIVAAIADRGIK